MTVFTEGARTAEFLMQGNPDIVIDPVTYSSGANIVAGQVVKGADTVVVPAVATDTTGLFLSYGNYDATAAARKGAAVKRNCSVNRNLITYPSGATAPQRAAIDAALLLTQIVVRS
jgi:hypothetical protein